MFNLKQRKMLNKVVYPLVLMCCLLGCKDDEVETMGDNAKREKFLQQTVSGVYDGDVPLFADLGKNDSRQKDGAKRRVICRKVIMTASGKYGNIKKLVKSHIWRSLCHYCNLFSWG